MPEPAEDDGWQSIGPMQANEEDSGAWVSDVNDASLPSEPDTEFMTSFDGRWRREFEGLAYLGHLQGAVHIPYHDFVVRTLKTGEKIKVIELVQHLEQSIGYARAYRAAVVAAALEEVDGKPLLVGSRRIDTLSQKYQYLIDNWYDYVIDILFDKVNELEGTVLEVLKELGVYQPRREVAQAEKAEVTGTVDKA